MDVGNALISSHSAVANRVFADVLGANSINLITVTSRKLGCVRLLRRDKWLPRRIDATWLFDHWRCFGLIASRFSEQSVVKVRQAVLCDGTSMNHVESNGDDARVARRQRNELPNNVSAVGKDLAVFVDTLH